MAKTWSDLLGEARVLLQDTDEPYRYTDAVLLSKLNRGLQELARLRPDAFWNRFSVDDVVVPEVATSDPDPVSDPAADFDPTEGAVVADTDDVDIPMQFYSPLVFWVVSNAELLEDEFTSDGRAAALLSQFKGMVIGL